MSCDRRPNAARRVRPYVLRALPGEIDNQRADHPPHRFVHQAPRIDFGILAQHLLHMACEEADPGELLDRQQTRAQAVVDVVIVVGDLVG